MSTSETVEPTLGLVQESNEQYHAAPGISKSHLDDVARSPYYYWAMRISENRPARVETPAMRLGTATHSAILEPELFEQNYAVMPEDAPNRPSTRQIKAAKPSAETVAQIAWWRDFEAANVGRIFLPVDHYQHCLAMRDAVHDHPIAGPLFQNGVAERSVYGRDPETGMLIKCRPDYLSESLLVDLKKTADSGAEAFARSVSNYRYYVQDPFYRHVLRNALGGTPPFVFVAVEDAYPHEVEVYYLPAADVERGERAWRRDMARLADCMKKKTWPRRSNGAQELALPVWRRQSEDALAA